jgi:acyl-CoA reductase-like NAD-dependent aldehyde dehydrogenase
MAIAHATKEFASLAPEIRAAYETAERLSNHILIDGRLTAAQTDATFEVENPADRSVIAHMPSCTQADVDKAVASALKAQKDWAKVPARERGRLLGKALDRIEEEWDACARLLCLETGNALSTQARPEIGSSMDMMRNFAGLGGELKGNTVPWTDDTIHFTTCDPLGVVGAIIPWNAPVFLLGCKAGPALVAGNTMVLKTASPAPLAVLRVAEIMNEILPPGVLNVISGAGGEVGKAICVHPDVHKVTFTGSGPVGQDINEYVARKLCPVTLELGGKSPNIVMPDADLDLVIPGIVLGVRFTRQGQSCTAGTRIFLHKKVHDEVVERTVEALANLRIGLPLDEETEVGCIINAKQFNRVSEYVEMARNTPGASILCGGKKPDGALFEKGLYYEPTLVGGLGNDDPVCQDEIFGPVANILPWTDFDAVIEEANDTEFGLAATLWTRDLHRAIDFSKRIEAGLVQVNQYGMPIANVAYGGLKMSGVGKENTLEAMIDHFTQSKTVIINQGTPAPH